MKRLLALPSALLLILATASGESHQPDQDRRLESRAENREDAVTHQLAAQAPVALRKMSPGEKFYPHYWQFDLEEKTISSALAEDTFMNASIPSDLLPPLHLHSDEAWKSSAGLRRHWPRNLFDKRDYQCPAGTGNCANIGRPNSCCATGEQCMHVTDTGSGDVGCCPAGATCGGSISSCNTAGGFTACPDSSNGGCCIPGYTCDSIGCVATGTTTTTASGSTVVVAAGSTSVLTASTTTITPVPASATTVTQVSTLTVTPSTSSPQTSTFYSTTTTPTSTVTISPSVSTATALSVITITASPAVLATSISQAPVNSVSTTTVTPNSSAASDTAASGYCPTGYFQCSAYYQGCCQIGYDCATSSCVSIPTSTTVLSGSAITIVVVTGSGVTTVTDGAPTNTPSASSTSGGTIIAGAGASITSSTATVGTTYTGGGFCATGWFSCDASNGGGCCPSGYSCAASCIATQTGEPGRVYKVAPSNSANGKREDHMTLLMSALVISAIAGLLWK